MVSALQTVPNPQQKFSFFVHYTSFFFINWEGKEMSCLNSVLSSVFKSATCSLKFSPKMCTAISILEKKSSECPPLVHIQVSNLHARCCGITVVLATAASQNSFMLSSRKKPNFIQKRTKNIRIL